MLRLTCVLKSAKRPLLSKLTPLWVVLSLGVLGCGTSGHPAGLAADGGAPTKPGPRGNDCESPAEGCTCPTPGATADCGQVERRAGDYVTCSMGVRTCTDGQWGTCIGDRVASIRVPSGTQHVQGLGTTQLCDDNPCDPYCRIIVDDPNGLALPSRGALTSDGGLQLVPSVQVAANSQCTSMVVSPTPQALTVVGFSSAGLFGEYFNQIDSTVPQIPASWVPVGTRVDPVIDVDWGTSGPLIASIGTEKYSVRWSGLITAQTTEAYRICAASDDGSRLWIDGNLVVDNWSDHARVEVCGAPVAWTAGSTHSVRFEFYQDLLFSTAQLSWATPTIAKQVVPASALSTPQGTPGQPPIVTGTSQFQVALNPPGCYAGTPQPSWTLDRLDLATIDSSGQVSLNSAVAGPITVTAYLGSFAATGVLNVAVDVSNTDSAPPGSVARFQGAAAGTDPAQILYPYDQTVLPIGLRPPVIQWDNRGTAASAVKVSLRYPATGAATFNWSQIIAEAGPPQATIPRQIWSFFEQSAKGQAAAFSVQRLIGTQPRPAMMHALTLASAPLQGHIYYTQYQRNGGAGVADVMTVDPASDGPALPAFSAHDGCPVCHSMSASGNVFAAANNAAPPSSQTLGGISSVNSNGSLSPIADFVPSPARDTYQVGSEGWGGFAWSALTPDGQYALVANNVWGNTAQQVVGIDDTRQVNVPTSMLSGGGGLGLLAQYYPSTTYSGTAWKRIDPQVNFDFGAGSPSPIIPNDYSVKRAGQVQAYFSEPYTFEVVTSDTVSLTVGSATSPTATGTVILNVTMTAGALVPIELDEINSNGNSNVQLYWSSPSTPRTLVPQTQLFLPASEPPHGALASYFANPNFTGTSLTRLEPDIASSYLAHSPAAGIGPDNWTDTWDAQLESPFTGAISLCVDSDDAVAVTLDGGPLASITSTATGPFTRCSNEALLWTAGNAHTVHLQHHHDTGNARLVLSWRYAGVNEIISSLYLSPVGYTPPATGLTATYYGTETFNSGLAQNPTNPLAFQRIDPNIDFDFGSGRPNYSAIPNDDHYSARWTGQINPACSGVYEFKSNGNIDDGGRVWIDNTRVMGVWATAPLSGGLYLDAGPHDFKFDWHEGTLNATARLMWRTPCAGSPGWETVPSSVFTPAVSASETGGFVRDGGDNGNNSSYWVWRTPTTLAPIPVDVTGATPGNWGLGSAAMMVPAFSPDGSKLVFIDGDSAGGAGWRKGVSTWDFDQNAQLFRNRKLLVNAWPTSDVLKWPTFESDSQSVIYQSTVPGDLCCRNSGRTTYGYMAPTNYYEDPGRLWSVDATAAATNPVLLRKLNGGEQPTDANKSYQPSVLPVAAGGYRWVVFTSTRPYGNTENLASVQQDFSNPTSYATASYTAMTNTSDLQSQLWVSAIDDTTSNTADRSHPSFWLPNQNFAPGSNSTLGILNERAIWVLDACHPAGKTNASSCEVDEDCCGGLGPTKTGACRLDTPLANPPTRHCHALPAPGDCEKPNASCGSTSDCCAGLVCLGASCQTPAGVLALAPANYERIYQADCPLGTKPIWRFFDWKTTTPDTNSSLEFYAETEADPANFLTLPPAPVAVVADGVARIGTAKGAPVVNFTGFDVDLLFQSLMPPVKSQQYLKVTVRFIPNDERTASPILNDWRQIYSCVPAE